MYPTYRPYRWDKTEDGGIVCFVICGRSVRYNYSKTDDGICISRIVTSEKGLGATESICCNDDADLSVHMIDDLIGLQSVLEEQPIWTSRRYLDYYARLVDSGVPPVAAGIEVKAGRDAWEGTNNTPPPLLYELVREASRSGFVVIKDEMDLYDWGYLPKEAEDLTRYAKEHCLCSITFNDPMSRYLICASKFIVDEFEAVDDESPRHNHSKLVAEYLPLLTERLSILRTGATIGISNPGGLGEIHITKEDVKLKGQKYNRPKAHFWTQRGSTERYSSEGVAMMVLVGTKELSVRTNACIEINQVVHSYATALNDRIPYCSSERRS